MKAARAGHLCTVQFLINKGIVECLCSGLIQDFLALNCILTLPHSPNF